jgi:deoxyribodipyrimidine photo-lyase
MYIILLIMSKENLYEYGIFIFRKDLRIIDNRGLINLSKKCNKIIPIFIFDPKQVDFNTITKNYLSIPALRFICESVKDLNNSIINSNSNSKLNIFYGEPIKVIKHIQKYITKHLNLDQTNIIIGFNADYTNYSLKRDNIIINYCQKQNIKILICDDDYVMCKMELMLKTPETKTPYKQFGAFKKNMLKQINEFNKVNNIKINFVSLKINIPKTLTLKEIEEFWKCLITKKISIKYNPLEIGSRKLGLEIINNLKKFKDYNIKRDTLSYNTTHLSAYLNFGLISERELYWNLLKKLDSTTQLLNQVIWRDYYLCILRYLKNASSYTTHIDPRYEKIKWTKEIPVKTSKVWYEWKLMINSKTGFLLIDAAIQELKQTGFMHNRCRMIVGVFSVKYLKINPLCRYIGLNDWFSRYLLDCSTSQNKLNTQWISELDFPGKKFAPSSSPISGRPMNICNNMIKKWDLDCIYIKKWLPHLIDIDNKIIYEWNTKYIESIHPKPIFDSKIRYAEWIKLCEI